MNTDLLRSLAYVPIKHLIIILVSGVTIWAGASSARAVVLVPTLWNRLESAANVEASEIGLDGQFHAGGFTSGFFGNAFLADQDFGVTFPKEVIPVEAGAIEFWGRLTGFPSSLPGGGQRPSFVTIGDGFSSYLIHLNGNDGAGNGGLCGAAGHGYLTGSGDWGWGWTYEQILGVGQAEEWHHYALVWNKDGIPGVADGTKNLAVFLDGELESGRWVTQSGAEFKPLVGGELALVYQSWWQTGEQVAIDNLKIWDYAKTDFSDRYFEGIIPEPSSLIVWSLLATLGITVGWWPRKRNTQ